MDCIFCEKLNKNEYILENELAVAIFDAFPVNKGHMLIIPKRHFASFFEATSQEVLSCMELVNKAKQYLDNEYNPDGYNIGINVGEAAGQTIFHLHIHIIPRYMGDVENPRGGIRKLKTPLVEYDG